MESKKLSRTVRKRLNKKARLQATVANPSIETESTSVQVHPATPATPSKVLAATPSKVLPAKPSKEQKKMLHAAQAKPVMTKSIQRLKRHPDNKVIYISSNYRGNDPNSVGARIQDELVGLRKESKNIKTASDLTESQAHVVKRQITRLQSAAKFKVGRRPKNATNSLSEATKELMLMIEKGQQKFVNKNAKTKT